MPCLLAFSPSLKSYLVSSTRHASGHMHHVPPPPRCRRALPCTLQHDKRSLKPKRTLALWAPAPGPFPYPSRPRPQAMYPRRAAVDRARLTCAPPPLPVPRRLPLVLPQARRFNLAARLPPCTARPPATLCEQITTWLQTNRGSHLQGALSIKMTNQHAELDQPGARDDDGPTPMTLTLTLT